MYRFCLRPRARSTQNTNKHTYFPIEPILGEIQLYNAGGGRVCGGVQILHLFHSICNFQRIQCVFVCWSALGHGACGFASKCYTRYIYIYCELAIHYLRFFPRCDRFLPFLSPFLFARIYIWVRCTGYGSRLKWPLLSVLRFTWTFTISVSVFVVYTIDQLKNRHRMFTGTTKWVQNAQFKEHFIPVVYWSG